jgi:hypothetical protein
MKFQTTLLSHGKTATGVEVPPEVVASLGTSKKPAVRVTINGYTYRSSVAVMGGKFMLRVSAENRAGAGVAAGDIIEVDLELDTEPREVALPADFVRALEENADAKRFFEGLSYSNKRRHILGIEDAKTDQTRQLRIAKSIRLFQEGKV